MVAVQWLGFVCMLAAILAPLVQAEIDPRYDNSGLLYGKFPDKFSWGTATSAYQVEGAFNISGRGWTIWDEFTRTPGKIKDNSNGDVACDSYNKIKEDVKLMKDMGVQHYRFSIAWSRVMSDGTNKTYNPEGIAYYSRLVDELLANKIQPMATLYHWDLPQPLQDQGGWTNRTIVNHFKDYAENCFRELGNRIHLWLTFNEPWVSCNVGYGYGSHAPGLTDPNGTDVYLCAHHMILSHAEAYHTYAQFRDAQKGRVSITLNIDWKEPDNSTSTDDQAAALRAIQFMGGWFAHPIYVNGDYPDIMKSQVANKSAAQGIPSRLPAFTTDEKLRINGTHDYFGLNHYTTGLISTNIRNASTNRGYDADQDIQSRVDPSWKQAGSSWLFTVPWGLRKLLRFIRDNYGNPEVIITENGVSVNNASLVDQERIDFYRDYINNVLKASINDSCNVVGYTAWSLLDNFEWAEGYTERFGLHFVDFNDPARTRTPKASVGYIKGLVAYNGFEPSAPTEAPPTSAPSSAVPPTTPHVHEPTTASGMQYGAARCLLLAVTLASSIGLYI